MAIEQTTNSTGADQMNDLRTNAVNRIGIHGQPFAAGLRGVDEAQHHQM